MIALAADAAQRWLPMRSAPKDGRPLVLQHGEGRVGRFTDLLGWVAPMKFAPIPDVITPAGWLPLPTEWCPMSSAPRDGRAIVLRDGDLGAIVGRYADGAFDTPPNACGFVETLEPIGWAPLPADRDHEQRAA